MFYNCNDRFFCNTKKKILYNVILIRDVKDTTVGTLSQRITNQLMGLKGLNQKLKDMHSYLERVAMGELPMNHEITYHLQVI